MEGILTADTSRYLKSNRLSEKEIAIRRIKNSAPIFIIGSQRSGTSFLYRLVQRHLRIGFGRDNGHFIRLIKLLPFYGDLNDLENLRRLVKDIIEIPDFAKRFKGLHIDVDEFIENMEERTYAEIVRRFYAEWAYLKGADRWGGKTPDYAIHARELFQLFPDAKFVHLIRDGRDVALSLSKLEWGPKDPLLAALHWGKRVQGAINFGRDLGRATYIEMFYEKWVQHPEREFARLLRFIDYGGDQFLLVREFEKVTSPKVKRDNYNKWKKEMSQTQVKAFERMGGELLDFLGYEVTHPELLGENVSLRRLIWHHLQNAFRKLLRGEGIKGLINKIKTSRAEYKLKFRSTRKAASTSRSPSGNGDQSFASS